MNVIVIQDEYGVKRVTITLNEEDTGRLRSEGVVQVKSGMTEYVVEASVASQYSKKIVKRVAGKR